MSTIYISKSTLELCDELDALLPSGLNKNVFLKRKVKEEIARLKQNDKSE